MIDQIGGDDWNLDRAGCSEGDIGLHADFLFVVDRKMDFPTRLQVYHVKANETLEFRNRHNLFEQDGKVSMVGLAAELRVNVSATERFVGELSASLISRTARSISRVCPGCPA